MKELIKITQHEGRQAVSARELHSFLGATERFSNWFGRQTQYGFVEGIDFTGCEEFNTLANQTLTDFALTIDCAKEISMLQRSEKGKQARLYFIACEKKLKEVSKPLSQLELIIQSAQALLEQEKRMDNVEREIKEIKAQTVTRPDYFTVAGYATLNGISCGLKLASSLGRKASSLCKSRDIATESIPDPRFGRVKTYPMGILEEVFEMAIV